MPEILRFPKVQLINRESDQNSIES